MLAQQRNGTSGPTASWVSIIDSVLRFTISLLQAVSF